MVSSGANLPRNQVLNPADKHEHKQNKYHPSTENFQKYTVIDVPCNFRYHRLVFVLRQKFSFSNTVSLTDATFCTTHSTEQIWVHGRSKSEKYRYTSMQQYSHFAQHENELLRQFIVSNRTGPVRPISIFRMRMVWVVFLSPMSWVYFSNLPVHGVFSAPRLFLSISSERQPRLPLFFSAENRREQLMKERDN